MCSHIVKRLWLQNGKINSNLSLPNLYILDRKLPDVFTPGRMIVLFRAEICTQHDPPRKTDLARERPAYLRLLLHSGLNGRRIAQYCFTTVLLTTARLISKRPCLFRHRKIVAQRWI